MGERAGGGGGGGGRPPGGGGTFILANNHLIYICHVKNNQKYKPIILRESG